MKKKAVGILVHLLLFFLSADNFRSGLDRMPPAHMSWGTAAYAAHQTTGTGITDTSFPTGTGQGTPVRPPKRNQKTVAIFTGAKQTPGDKALYAYLGQLPNVQRIHLSRSPDAFFTHLAKLASDGKKIDSMIILGHGSADIPHIQMAGPEDLVLEHFDLSLIKARIAHISGEAEKAEKNYCQAQAERNFTAALEHAKALTKLLNALRRYRHNLENLQQVRGIMNPDARILLLNCSAAATPGGEEFVKAIGAALMTQGGVIKASRTDINVGQVAADGSGFIDGLWGFTKWTMALLWYGEVTNPGDYYVSPDGYLPRWLSNNWVEFAIAPQTDFRPYDHGVTCYQKTGCTPLPRDKPVGPVQGPLGFSGTVPNNWTGGSNDKGFHFQRQQVSGGGKPKDCVGEAVVNGEVSGLLTPSSAPHTVEEIRSRLEAELADMKRYLSFAGGEVTPYALSGFTGFLMHSRPQFKGGSGSPLSGYRDLTALAAGHGYVTREGKTVEVRYAITSSGCWNQSQRSFQEAEVSAAQAEAASILASLGLQAGGTFTTGAPVAPKP